jgi:hypothetical protein
LSHFLSCISRGSIHQEIKRTVTFVAPHGQTIKEG